MAGSICVIGYTLDKLREGNKQAIDSMEKLQKKADETIQQLNRSLDIAREILNGINNIPNGFKSSCPEKLWMLARHPEFCQYLQRLIDKGYVEELDRFFKFKYTFRGTNGYNILAYFILDFADLRKWAETPKSRSKKDDNIFKGIFSKKAYEPFSVGFGISDLQTNIRGNIPKDYNNFLKKLGLKSQIDKIYR